MSTAVVTTVSRNYLSLARVLMGSVGRLHPEVDRYVLVLDDLEGVEDAVGGASLLTPSDLVDDPHELAVLRALYKPIELATALKPALLLHVLERAERVFFVDPDMRLFARMDAAIESLDRGRGVLLTPHRLDPPPYPQRGIEWVSRAYGAFNTAFVGATSADRPFLEWWRSRLHRDCLADLKAMQWVDQKVVDLAPGYFPVDVLRHPGYNVAWWNLAERPLRKVEGRWRAGEDELVVMHYSNVHLKGGEVQSLKGRLPQLVHRPDNPVASDPAYVTRLWELELDYMNDLRTEGYDHYSRLPYGWSSTSGGRVLSDQDRRYYRRVVLREEVEGRPAPLPDDISWDFRTRFRETALSVRTSPRARETVRHVARTLRVGR